MLGKGLSQMLQIVLCCSVFIHVQFYVVLYKYLILSCQEAAEAAFALRNMEALSALEIKASRNVSLLETIAGYKQRLQLSSK